MNESKQGPECDSDCYLEVIRHNPKTRVWVVRWVHSHSTNDCMEEKALVIHQPLKKINGVRTLGKPVKLNNDNEDGNEN